MAGRLWQASPPLGLGPPLGFALVGTPGFGWATALFGQRADSSLGGHAKRASAVWARSVAPNNQPKSIFSQSHSQGTSATSPR